MNIRAIVASHHEGQPSPRKYASRDLGTNLTYVKGNIEDPLSDPFVQKDTSPVKQVAKKSSVTQSSSNDLNISSYT